MTSVLMVTHFYPPHLGGIEQVAEEEVNRLQSNGVEVRVLTSTSGAPKGLNEPHVHRVKAIAPLKPFGVPFPVFAPSLIWRAAALVRSSEVVHVHDALYITSWVTALLCRLYRRPMVVTQHVARVDHPWRIVMVVQRLVYSSLARLVWRNARYIFYLNGNVKTYVVEQGVPSERLIALPNGVDLEQFRPPIDAEERMTCRRRLGLPLDAELVLFVGRLVPKKGYKDLIQAAQSQSEGGIALRDDGERSRSGGCGWTAVLVGDGAEVTPTSSVLPMGPLGRDELSTAFRACDVFALPSRGEGFPLTVQEAMASGLPVLTTDDPGYAMYDLDRRRVMLIEPGVGRLASAVQEIVADDERQASMGTYSRAFAEKHFSWPAHVAELTERYLTVRRPVERGRLVQNAVALLASAGATSLFGLLFWSLAARWFAVADVGVATSILSSVQLLAYFSLCGMSASFVRFVPVSRDPDGAVSAGVTLIGTVALVLGVGYALLLGPVSPSLAHAFHGLSAIALITFGVALTAVNLATDSVFIARRAAKWNPVVDGLLQGGVKVAVLPAFVMAAAAGPVIATVLGNAAAVVASVWLIRRRLGLRLRATAHLGVLRTMASYSASSYVSSILNLLPQLILPVLALRELGSRNAAWYFVAFQLALPLWAIPFAICESLFAEASHHPDRLRQLAVSSARLIALVVTPVALGLAVVAPYALEIFGPSYRAQATALLRILCLGAIPVALNSWTSFILRIRLQMRLLVVSNVVYVIVAIGLGLTVGASSLEGMGWAWNTSNLASALVAAWGLRGWRRSREPLELVGDAVELACASAS
jgi:rhamnosyl/mannosyltransferase